MQKTLTVVVEAATPELIDSMIESLARLACDVANSTADDKAHIFIWITEQEQEQVQVPAPVRRSAKKGRHK